jgi:hypothetical protein
LAGNWALTTKTFTYETIGVIGSKSLSGSYGIAA